MEITEVKVFPINEEKLKAFASVVFDGCFMVNDIKVIRGRDGLFISMPSRKKKNGEFKDVAHPLNNDTRKMIEGFVLGEYQRILTERGDGAAVEAAARPLPAAEPAPRPAAEAPEQRPQPAAVPAPPARRPAPQRGPDARPEAPPLAAAAAGEAKPPAPPAESADPADQTLEEVQEIHLRDSFWTVS